MSRTFNIANVQLKWLQEFINTHLLETGIIRGRDHWAQHIFYLPETPDPFPQLSHRLTRLSGVVIQCEKVPALEGMWWGICLWVSVDFGPVYGLILFWLPLDFLDTSNTRLGLKRLQTSGYVLSSHLTSQAPALTSNVPSTQARASAAYTILPPAITSDAADGWQCDPRFKT